MIIKLSININVVTSNPIKRLWEFVVKNISTSNNDYMISRTLLGSIIKPCKLKQRSTLLIKDYVNLT